MTPKWQIDGWIIVDGAYHVKIGECERRYIATIADSKMQLCNNVIWHRPQSAKFGLSQHIRGCKLVDR